MSAERDDVQVRSNFDACYVKESACCHLLTVRPVPCVLLLFYFVAFSALIKKKNIFFTFQVLDRRVIPQ